MMKQGQIRILSVDDHPAFGEGIAAQATTGRGGILAYKEFRPDLTLMDVRLPDLSGIEAVTAIRSEDRTARVLMLSTYEGDANVAQSLAAGACGYMLKTMVPSEMLAAIRAVHTGEPYVSPAAASRLAVYLADQSITSREVEILKHVSTGNSNRAIANLLFISEQTVKAHLRHIMQKLDASDRAHCVAIAIRRGFLEM